MPRETDRHSPCSSASYSSLLMRNDHTPNPRAPYAKLGLHLDSKQGVPINLTCKLTRKQQTVKFKSVSAGFPNHSHAAYHQDSADTENDSRSGIKNVY